MTKQSSGSIFLSRIKEHLFDVVIGLSGFGIFGLAMVDYILRIFYQPSDEHYKVLFSLVGLTATFGVLSFNASNNPNNKNEQKRRNLYECGESLFHATLIFGEVILIRYFFDVMRLFLSKHLSMVPFGIVGLRMTLTVIALIGMFVLTFGLADLHACMNIIRSNLRCKQNQNT